MTKTALAWSSVAAIVGSVLVQWVLTSALATAAGQTNGTGTLGFDPRFLPVYLLPEIVLITGLLVSVGSWWSGRGFLRPWFWTLALMLVSAVGFWFLFAMSEGQVVRGVPDAPVEWASAVARWMGRG